MVQAPLKPDTLSREWPTEIFLTVTDEQFALLAAVKCSRWRAVLYLTMIWP